MHNAPVPQNGGRHLQPLCTEFCRLLFRLRSQQFPHAAIRSHLEAVKRTYKSLGISVVEEIAVAPGRHADFLIQQIVTGCALGGVIGRRRPLYQRALLQST
jgi:hypothetical protein